MNLKTQVNFLWNPYHEITSIVYKRWYVHFVQFTVSSVQIHYYLLQFILVSVHEEASLVRLGQ